MMNFYAYLKVSHPKHLIYAAEPSVSYCVFLWAYSLRFQHRATVNTVQYHSTHKKTSCAFVLCFVNRKFTFVHSWEVINTKQEFAQFETQIKSTYQKQTNKKNLEKKWKKLKTCLWIIFLVAINLYISVVFIVCKSSFAELPQLAEGAIIQPLLSIFNINKYQTCVFIFKILHQPPSLPLCCGAFFQLNVDVHNCNTRRAKCVHLPKFLAGLCQSSVRYEGAQLWNS